MPRKQQDEIVRHHIASIDQLRLFEFAKEAGDAYAEFIAAVRHAPEQAPVQVAALAERLRGQLTAALAPEKERTQVRLRRIKKRIGIEYAVEPVPSTEASRDATSANVETPAVVSAPATDDWLEDGPAGEDAR